MSQLLGRILAATVALAAAGLAQAQGEGARAAAEPRPDLIYHNYCSVCHGDRGDSRSRARGSLNPPPADFTTAAARRVMTRERMIAALNHGRPGTAMTSWASQLSAKEIEAVVDFIRDTMMAPEPGSALARGRALYGHHCIACHGERGQGVASLPAHPAPRPFSRDAERARMLAAVSEGRFGTLSHAFAGKLKREELENTVDYIHNSLAPGLAGGVSGTRAHGGRSRDAGFPEGLSGNAERGRRLYTENCAACHGAKADGKGPRATLLNTKPRDFAEPATRAAYNRPALYAAIAAGRQGTDMPAWSAVLSRQQIADVAEYVWRSFFNQN